jgi:hypothetical protein
MDQNLRHPTNQSLKAEGRIILKAHCAVQIDRIPPVMSHIQAARTPELYNEVHSANSLFLLYCTARQVLNQAI